MQGTEKTKNDKTTANKSTSEPTLPACGCRWCDDVSDYVANNPLCSLLLAALGGMVLGFLARACRCRKCGGTEAGNSCRAKSSSGASDS